MGKPGFQHAEGAFVHVCETLAEVHSAGHACYNFVILKVDSVI